MTDLSTQTGGLLTEKQGIPTFQNALLRWYRLHGRHDLPWRQTDEPYHVYISEVMLQQTQVKTVLERFYFPFLNRFPTLHALAEASEEAVLQQWQGLGYYSRARNLHRAAMACGGQLPQTVDALLALPGIGQNTAHAILAFGFRQPYAVMEANVKRLLCRLFAYEKPTDKMLWQAAEALLNKKNPFDHNQAMMDLGSLICTPAAPLCAICPVQKLCAGKASPLAFPAAKAAKATPIRKKQIFVVVDSLGQIYYTPRQTRFLGGLYHFIERPESSDGFSFQGRKYPLSALIKLGDIIQTYSHFQLQADVYVLRLSTAQNDPAFLSADAFAAAPCSGAEEKIKRLLRQHGV